MGLQRVELVALKKICGDYGVVAEGGRFVTDNVTAQALESRGLAERYYNRSRWRDLVGKMIWPSEDKMLRVEENKTVAHPPPSAAPRSSAPVFTPVGTIPSQPVVKKRVYRREQ